MLRGLFTLLSVLSLLLCVGPCIVSYFAHHNTTTLIERDDFILLGGTKGFVAHSRFGRFEVPVAVFLILPLAWYVVRCRGQSIRRSRSSAGLCTQCGYDLRATPRKIGPHLDRCPECGVLQTR
ncbi:MAG TPA: hypothetical protein VG269_02990 [Tepidisphaeraceae bacterium]|jgi:hypothetical protein|nr:hypothetical protein [Tepidisphaeraceae bacterium]